MSKYNYNYNYLDMALQEQAYQNSRRWFPEVYDRPDEEVMLHVCAGIVGESGEVVDILKKVHTEKKTFEEKRAHLLEECADVFVYLMVAGRLVGVGISMKEFSKTPHHTDPERPYFLLTSGLDLARQASMVREAGVNANISPIKIGTTVDALGRLTTRCRFSVDQLIEEVHRKWAVCEERWGNP